MCANELSFPSGHQRSRLPCCFVLRHARENRAHLAIIPVLRFQTLQVEFDKLLRLMEQATYSTGSFRRGSKDSLFLGILDILSNSLRRAVVRESGSELY